MNKLFEFLTNDPDGASILMIIGTICLSILLGGAYFSYIGIYQVVNQCHVLESNHD